MPQAGEILLSTVASVFTKEDVAQRLLNVQKFDLIDIEGAGIIYDHLLSLLGSDEAVEALLAHSVLDMVSVLGLLTQYFEASSQREPDEECIDKTKKALPPVIQELISMRETLSSPSDASLTAFCVGMSEQEGAMLLNLWLIALAAKDASLIVSLHCTQKRPSSPPFSLDR